MSKDKLKEKIKNIKCDTLKSKLLKELEQKEKIVRK
jgi:hypothetical protein